MPSSDLNSGQFSGALPLQDAASGGDVVLTDAESKTLSDLEEYFRRSKQMKQLIAYEVLMNYAFFANEHDVYWDNATGRLRRSRLPFKSYYYANFVQQLVVQFVSKMTRKAPSWTVPPGGADMDDVFASRGAQKLLDYYYRTFNVRSIVEEAMLLSALAGVCWVKVAWDPSLGDEIPPVEDVLGMGMPDAGAMPTKTGDVTYRVIDFFQGFPDPQCVKMDSTPQRFMETHYMYRWEIAQHWGPEAAAKVAAGSSGVSIEDDQYGTIFFMQRAEVREKEAESEHAKQYLIKEFSEMPSPEYPRGRFVQYCGKVILANADLPTCGNGNTPARLGVRAFFYLKHPRRAFPIPLASPLRAANEEYNATRRHQAEYRRLMVRGAWLNPRGSGVPKSQFVAQDGSIIDYRPVGMLKPERIDIRPMPSQQEHLSLLTGEMQGQANIREITKGFAPANVSAASALAILQEQDQSSDALIRRNYEDGVAWIGQETLFLLHENMDFPRKVAIAGELGQFEVEEFDRSKVKPWNVFVQEDSMLPKSKYAQMSLLTEAFKAGAIAKDDGSPDAKRFARLAGHPFFEQELYDADALDEQNAQKAVRLVREGQPVAVDKDDNHEIYARVYERAIKMLRFSTDPRDIAARETLRQLREQHLMALLLAMQASMPPEAPPGGPGAPPEAPPEGKAAPDSTGGGMAGPESDGNALGPSSGGIG